MRSEVRIAGFGGQGIVLAGYVIGKALALYDGYHAVMTQAYGPEARGGASSANIVVSDEPVDYPFVQQPDVLVALSQEAYTRFHKSTKQDAIILLDEDLVKTEPEEEVLKIPATHLAEELGKRIVANIVMIGFFTGVTKLVNQQAVEMAIRTSVKQQTIDLNINAFQTGVRYANIHEEGRNVSA
jgi:2-oxoglutarate ferredoxin oxidoreductase subunit gamma